MQKKYKHIFGAGVFLILLFYAGLAFALEITYPEIKIGQKSIAVGTNLPSYVKYLFAAGTAIGFFSVFLSLIIAGVMYFLAPISAEIKANAKDRASGAIAGLLILASVYLIVTTINPELGILKLNEPDKIPPPPAEKPAPGVYFYSQADCSDTNAQSHVSSVADLGDLKNKINAVSIVQDYDNQVYYVSVLYDTVDFRGICKYIDPNEEGCQSAPRWANSASVYKYDFEPNSDGVYFYRKSFFNDKGGYFKVNNSEIKGLYLKSLNDLQFQNVPDEEQNCTKYDLKGNCVNREIPTLGGENISSIKIKGNYIVILSYADYSRGETCKTVQNTSCQEFPTPDDASKNGPVQLKWEKIRNNMGVIPNCVTIIPVKP